MGEVYRIGFPLSARGARRAKLVSQLKTIYSGSRGHGASAAPEARAVVPEACRARRGSGVTSSSSTLSQLRRELRTLAVQLRASGKQLRVVRS